MEEVSHHIVKIFYCYAHEDKAFREELDIHLSPLKRQGLIATWSDREIQPGMQWAKEIDDHLNTSHLILLLVSPHFIASEYCYGIEMKRALERHGAGDARRTDHYPPRPLASYATWRTACFTYRCQTSEKLGG